MRAGGYVFVDLGFDEVRAAARHVVPKEKARRSLIPEAAGGPKGNPHAQGAPRGAESQVPEALVRCDAFTHVFIRASGIRTEG